MGHSHFDDANRERAAWNAGKKVGTKRPFTQKQIWAIRFFLDRERRIRDRALTDKGITPCIPSSRSRKIPFVYDKDIYRQRHRVENLFAKLKDWRRIATRYDRCAHTFLRQECTIKCRDQTPS